MNGSVQPVQSERMPADVTYGQKAEMRMTRAVDLNIDNRVLQRPRFCMVRRDFFAYTKSPAAYGRASRDAAVRPGRSSQYRREWWRDARPRTLFRVIVCA